TVTSDTGSPESFDSGNMIPAQMFSRAFPNPGTYRYYCKIHASAGDSDLGMKGKVIVLAADATPPPATVVSTAYFAEGTVRDGFQEFITLQNPGDGAGIAQLRFQAADDGGNPVSIDPLNVALPASSRKTVDVNNYVRSKGVTGPVNLAIQVNADRPINSERPLYFNASLAGGVNGGTDVIGAPEPGTTFYFAEGTVRPGFQEFLTLQNPLTATADVTVRFQAADDAIGRAWWREGATDVGATGRVTKNVTEHIAKT